MGYPCSLVVQDQYPTGSRLGFTASNVLYISSREWTTMQDTDTYRSLLKSMHVRFMADFNLKAEGSVQQPCLGYFGRHPFPSLPSLLRCALIVGETALEHVGPQFASPRTHLIPSLCIGNMNSSQKERGIPILHSPVSFLKYWYSTLWVASWPVLQGVILVEFNLVIFSRLPNHQIKTLTKFSCYTVMLC